MRARVRASVHGGGGGGGGGGGDGAAAGAAGLAVCLLFAPAFNAFPRVSAPPISVACLQLARSISAAWYSSTTLFLMVAPVLFIMDTSEPVDPKLAAAGPPARTCTHTRGERKQRRALVHTLIRPITHTHTHTHTHTRTHRHTHTHSLTHSLTHSFTHPLTHTLSRHNMHAQARPYLLPSPPPKLRDARISEMERLLLDFNDTADGL